LGEEVTSVKHHHTPRHYLKRFENSEGKLWRLDVANGIIATGNNDRFGFKNHWNRLKNPPSGYDVDWAEKKIAEIDGAAANTMNRLMNGEFPDDIRPLAASIGFMTQHQPVVMKNLEVENSSAVQAWTPDWKLVLSLNAALAKGTELVPLSYAIYRLTEEQLHLRFLTSSNPLVEFDNKPNKFFPLSSRECLLLIYDPELHWSGSRFLPCDEELVAGINGVTLRNAWQYVYSCRADFHP
jgi:hypothetical protein